jgi:hypothetical protein
MPRLIRRRPLRWGAIAGAAGALLAAVALTGCPGDIDPSISMPSQGGSGTGGTSGGSSCTGGNSGDMVIASNCAVSGCHTGGSVPTTGAGLDLTIDSGIKGRLVGVMSSGASGNIFSMCGNVSEPYLTAGSNPATGLLVDKIHPSPPCGVQMPQVGTITTAQQNCIVQWATTLTTQ